MFSPDSAPSTSQASMFAGGSGPSHQEASLFSGDDDDANTSVFGGGDAGLFGGGPGKNMFGDSNEVTSPQGRTIYKYLKLQNLILCAVIYGK